MLTEEGLKTKNLTKLPVQPQPGPRTTLFSGPPSTYHSSNLEEIPCLSFPLLLSAPSTSAQSKGLSSGRALQRCSPDPPHPRLHSDSVMTGSGYSLARCLFGVSVPSAGLSAPRGQSGTVSITEYQGLAWGLYMLSRGTSSPLTQQVPFLYNLTCFWWQIQSCDSRLAGKVHRYNAELGSDVVRAVACDKCWATCFKSVRISGGG